MTTTIPDRALADRIAGFQAGLAQHAPPQVVKAIADDIDALVRAGTGGKAPNVGDLAPDFTLPDARGGRASLRALLETGPVVVAFYRGQWCPYCDLQLRAYQESLPLMRARGATLVAISPQTPDASLSTAEKMSLEFGVLADAGNQVARRYGLVFAIPPGLAAVQKGFGVDLATWNGDMSNELPVPGTFVVGADGRIALRYVDADFRKRLEPAAILRALDELGANRPAAIEH